MAFDLSVASAVFIAVGVMFAAFFGVLRAMDLI